MGEYMNNEEPGCHCQDGMRCPLHMQMRETVLVVCLLAFPGGMLSLDDYAMCFVYAMVKWFECSIDTLKPYTTICNRLMLLT